MKFSSPDSISASAADNATGGFTLVEVIVAIAVASIMAMGMVVHYAAQNKAYAIQRERAHMQQNLRAAMYLLKIDVRNCGRDPLRTGRYGIQSIVRMDPDPANAGIPLQAGFPGLILTGLQDTDGDGMAETNSPVQTIRFQVMDLNGDGRLELRRQDSLDTTVPPPWRLVMDGIEDIGFAFAYDDGRGDLARINGDSTQPVIWAIDSDNGNDLDTSLDTDADGDITIADTLNGALAPAVNLVRIRAVRIWLLARSRQAYPDFTDNSVYVMGSQFFDLTQTANANSRNFRHLLLTSVVALDNYQQ